MTGGQDQWQTYAAMGLVGKSREAIEGLRRFDCQEARFYSAVASWIDGDEATAIATLEKIPTPHAQNLLTLIRKPKILVLAQLPYTRLAPHDLLTAAAHDKKFKIQNISFHPDDLPNRPYADIHQFYDPRHPPDFYVCTMVEWHLIPPNLQELPCPIIGQTSDYDAHIQTVYPWLQLFDEFLVTDQTEWQDVRRLVRVPVSTFPKSFGISDTLPPVSAKPRKVDVFVSGSAIHPYHPDKVRLLNQTLRLPDHVGFVDCARVCPSRTLQPNPGNLQSLLLLCAPFWWDADPGARSAEYGMRRGRSERLCVDPVCRRTGRGAYL